MAGKSRQTHPGPDQPGGALPYEDKLRIQFFIDNAHFSDLGHDRVAEFFAANILAAERGTSFDFAAFAKRSAEIAAASR
jgi:hypothetical protein